MYFYSWYLLFIFCFVHHILFVFLFVILNIYTPFIIVAYLLSIPVMIQILKVIVKALVGDIEMTIPITITPIQIFIGLVGLLIAYYIAIGLSKRVLKKVPLSIALKRE